MKTKSDYVTQLDSYSYKQLLVECRELGLSARGNKTTLRKRLIGKRIKSTQGLKSPREKVDGVDEHPTSEDEEATASRPDRFRLNTPGIFFGPFFGPLLFSEEEVADSNLNPPEWLLHKNPTENAGLGEANGVLNESQVEKKLGEWIKNKNSARKAHMKAVWSSLLPLHSGDVQKDLHRHEDD